MVPIQPLPSQPTALPQTSSQVYSVRGAPRIRTPTRTPVMGTVPLSRQLSHKTTAPGWQGLLAPPPSQSKSHHLSEGGCPGGDT